MLLVMSDLIEYLNKGKISKIEEIGNQDYLFDLSMKVL